MGIAFFTNRNNKKWETELEIEMTVNITDYVHSCVDDYKHIVWIDYAPIFSLRPTETTMCSRECV